MIYGICGSREYINIENVKLTLDNLHTKQKIDKIITGGAKGPDRASQNWCKENNIECLVVRPIQSQPSHYYLCRDAEIVALSDVIIGFWDLKSRGTLFTLNYAYNREKPTFVVRDFQNNSEGENLKKIMSDGDDSINWKWDYKK